MNRTKAIRAFVFALGVTSVLFTALPAGSQPETVEVRADFHTLRTPARAPQQIELLTLSTMPDTVSGGDVLVGVRGLNAADALFVTRNGSGVTARFSLLKETGERVGLVEGLREGSNEIRATAMGPRGARTAVLEVRNHPVTGPIISGPHQAPFFCTTLDAGLGEPIDRNCSIKTQYDWYYRSLDQRFHELADPYAPYPDDVQMTESPDGRAVPFVVRVESATINRGIARIAVLDDPAARGAKGSFDASNWSHRILYAFGESCGVGYQQGASSPELVLGGLPSEINADRLLINFAGAADRLAHGDVIVHSTLSAFGVHCNPVVSVETTMMIKEHIIERYGAVEAIVGTNGSGAALQQYNAANNAPGLLTAAMPTASFADIATTAMTVVDCGLLTRYYENSDLGWSDQKRAAVNGHLGVPYAASICQSWVDTFLSRIDPTACPGEVPEEMRYDPKTNRTGVRCTVQDANVNVLGRDPSTGFARRPVDNTGVQYGLGALNSGTISFAEFIDLNRTIGGYDIDGRPVADRMVMDSELARLAYRTGFVIGRGALAETPVIDLAPYLDPIPVANIHEAVRPFVIRARLREQAGQDETQSIWRGVVTQPDAYPVMEQWFTALKASPGSTGVDRMRAVIAAKPADAQDGCVVATIGGRLEFPDGVAGPLGFARLPLLPGAPLPDVDVPARVAIPEDFDSGAGLCQAALPVTRTPRMVAGMPLSDDIIKCQLKPVDAADYTPALSPEQLTQVRAAFPRGVCDFTKRAAEDVDRSMIWTSFGGATLEEPHELRWRVARSGGSSSSVLGDKIARGGAGSELPSTGVSAVAPFAVALLAAAAAAAALGTLGRRR